MNMILKIAVLATSLVGMLIADVPLLPVPLVPDAQAILGVRRRTAVVVGTEVHAADEAQIAKSQQQTAAAQQEAAAAKQQAAAPALPAGCTSTPVGGVEYYYCGGNFYRAVFQGNTLVYVTTEPK